jgi:hypothetical protein
MFLRRLSFIIALCIAFYIGLFTIHFPDLDRLGLPTFEMMLCFLMPALMIVIDYCICYKPRVIMKFWENDSFRSFSYVTCLYLILLFGVFEKVDFIYFQF